SWTKTGTDIGTHTDTSESLPKFHYLTFTSPTVANYTSPGDDPADGPGKLIIINRTLDLSEYFATTPDLALAAIEEVHVEDSFAVYGGKKSGPDSGLAIGAPKVTIDSGEAISFDGLYLGIGADEDLSLTNVTLQCDNHLGLASLGDVSLTNVTLLGGHRSRVYVYAQNTLTVDGAKFSQNLSEIYMEANTVNLSNVDFPYGTDVTLKSQLGGIDGKYPNFGDIETGRVNFINEVKYGGNPIDSQQSFDQHGMNIKIGTISGSPANPAPGPYTDPASGQYPAP
ncbi:MAG: hypothetical protein VCA36_01420, partial [Opitutales bacterium]